MIPVIAVMFAVAAGTWLRYAVAPVLLAYEVGRKAEAILRRHGQAGR